MGRWTGERRIHMRSPITLKPADEWYRELDAIERGTRALQPNEAYELKRWIQNLSAAVARLREERDTRAWTH